MSPEALAEAFQEHHDAIPDRPDIHPGYCLSINCIPSSDADAVAMKARRPNGEMCVTTVEAIESAGFAVVPTPSNWNKTGHCDVVVKDDCEKLPTREQLELLSAAFSEPVPNPASIARRQGRG